MLRYNVAIVGKFFNEGSWTSEDWRNDHPEELADEKNCPPEMIASAEERREQLNLEPVPEGSVCGLRAHHIHTALG